MHKIGNCKIFGRPIFQEKQRYTKHIYINSSKSGIISLYDKEIILKWKNFNYMLEIHILGNDSEKYLGVLKVIFEGLGVQKTIRD